MLRSKSIVRYKCARAGPRCDVPDKVAICFGTSEVEPPAVQMKDRFARSPRGGMNPEARDIVKRACFECDVARWRDSLHQRIELRAGVAGLGSHAFYGTQRSSHRRDHRRIFRIESVYRDDWFGLHISRRRNFRSFVKILNL